MKAAQVTSNDFLAVSGGYDLDHLAYKFTQPDRVFRVSHFFIDYWLPILGPAQAWLVVALQQACWRNGARQADGQVSQRRLGQLCGLKRETVNRHLNNPNSLLRYFISATKAVHTADGGRTSNRYQVVLNDPLPPQFIAGLNVLFAEKRAQMASSDTSEIRPLIESLLAQDRHTLIATLNKQPNTKSTSQSPTTIRALIFETFNLNPQDEHKSIISLATWLSRHLLQPNQVYINSQYFREQWVPVLGPTQAWFLTVLRRHCYENKAENERRNTFTFEKKTIAANLGVSTKTLQRQLAKFKTIEPFFQSFTISHHTISGQISVNDDPLTPADEQKKGTIEQTLRQNEPKFQQLSLISPGGPKEDTAQSGQNIIGDNPKRQNITPLSNQKGTKNHIVSQTTRQNITAGVLQTRHKNTGDSSPNGQNITDSKHFSKSTLTDSTPTTQHTINDDGKPKKTTLELLDQLNIRPPTRDELAQLAHLDQPAYLADWVTWYTSQDTFGPGWVVQQLRAGLQPPVSEAQLLAMLPDSVMIERDGPSHVHENNAWQDVLTLLRYQMTKNTFDAWLKDTRMLTQNETVLRIGVGSPQAKAWLENRLKLLVERAVAQVYGKTLELHFEHDDSFA